MKKLILTLTVLFSFAIANAQSVNFGIKAGINLSNLYTNQKGVLYNVKAGFQGGIYTQIKFEKFAIQPELLYSTEGANADYSVKNSPNHTGVINTSHINLPVMVKVYFSSKFYLEVGPQISFLVSAKKTETLTNSEQGYDLTTDIKPFTQSIDYASNLGLGFDVIESFNVSIRYSAGLSDIYKTEDITTSYNVALFAGYKF